MTGSAAPRPNFLIIGAMKAGTSSLYRWLNAHPDIYMPPTKELHYFVGEYLGMEERPPPDTPCTWANGFDWYRSQFSGWNGEAAIGEATPKYTRWPAYRGAPARIRETLGTVRLVYLVRHPIERMRSHYLHYVSSGWESRPINRALLEEPLYRDASRYTAQLDQYLEWFDADDIHVATTDSLRDDPRGTVASVVSFLGLDPSRVPTELPQAAHASSDKRLDNGALRLARRLPGKQMLPRKARMSVRNTFTRPVTEWSEPIATEVELALADELAPDALGLRRFLGDEFDAWNIGVSARAERADDAG